MILAAFIGPTQEAAQHSALRTLIYHAGKRETWKKQQDPACSFIDTLDKLDILSLE